MAGTRAARGARIAALLACLIIGPVRRADADWLIVPFAGGSFAHETTFLIPEAGASRKLTFGGSVVLLTDGLLGIEGDFGHAPGFFEGDDPRGLVLTSRVTTIGGNVILAVPLGITQESLRPYVVGGLGLLQARTTNVAGLFPVEQDLLGVTIGAGAIGLVSQRTGFRFDVRHIKAASGADGPFARPGLSRLSFWRGTIGVVIRY